MYSAGKPEIIDIPEYKIEPEKIKVKILYSVYSKGTETHMQKSTSLIRRLMDANFRKKVFKKLLNEDLSELYDAYLKKKNAEIPAGYSSSGIIVEVGQNVTGFSPGDRVALSGENANHEEFSLVSPMMATKVPAGVSMLDAAFTTPGSIALEGIRCLNATSGEKIAVIGCGLLGQLALRILKFYGFDFTGFDIDNEKIEISRKLGFDVRHIEEIEENSFDGAVIFADSLTPEPLKKASLAVRKNGVIVLTGNCPIEFDREVMYIKGITFRVSTSYGAGRYDPLYELKGIDYPAFYVRWTIDRNKAEFLRMLSSGLKIDFPYKVVPFGSDFDSGAVFTTVFEYPDSVESKAVVELKTSAVSSQVCAAIIGYSEFAVSTHLKNFSKVGIRAKYLVSNRAKNIKLLRRYGVEKITNDIEAVLDDSDVNLIFVCTRHNRHGEEVIKSINAGKNVFVEKPLCLNSDELEKIIDVYKNGKSKVFVGFNRRYSILTQFLKDKLKRPAKMIYRINSYFPEGHWIFERDVGGGVLIGEGCHFIDFSNYIFGEFILEGVRAYRIDSGFEVFIPYIDGSSSTIIYTYAGNKGLEKEYIEVFGSGRSFRIFDFKKLEVDGQTKIEVEDKGHLNELKYLIKFLKGDVAVDFGEYINTMKLTFYIDTLI